MEFEALSSYGVHCLLVHETDSFIGNSSVEVANPMFVDAANGDYHIDASLSPAVDYCNELNVMAQFKDIDSDVRGYDDPTVVNNPVTNGAFDIGADETYDNDIIFADGFDN